MSGKKLKIADVQKFCFAGNATFTVVRPERTVKVVEGGVEKKQPLTRYTFKLTRAKGDESSRPWFAKVMFGPNNRVGLRVPGHRVPVGHRPGPPGVREVADQASSLRRRSVMWSLGSSQSLPRSRSGTRVRALAAVRSSRCRSRSSRASARSA
jgi:hypothetical protein